MRSKYPPKVEKDSHAAGTEDLRDEHEVQLTVVGTT